MKRSVLGCVLGLVLCSVMARAGAPAPGETLRFSFDRVGTTPMHFEIELDQATGRGTYRESAVPAVAAAPASEGADAGSVPAERPLVVTAPVLKKLFAAVPAVRSHRCESHSHGIAQTGTKTIRYAQGDGAAECTYNYSDDERLNAATELLEALNETMQFGDRLTNKLRFDRLGLDVEMENLQSAVSEGRAIELGNIASVLEAVQNDDRVMDRVRRKASRLLESAGVAQGQASADGASRLSSDR